MTNPQVERIKNAIKISLEEEEAYDYVYLSREDCQFLLENLDQVKPRKSKAGRRPKSIFDQLSERETEIAAQVLQMQRANPNMDWKEIMTKLGLWKSSGSTERQIDRLRQLCNRRKDAAIVLIISRHDAD